LRKNLLTSPWRSAACGVARSGDVADRGRGREHEDLARQVGSRWLALNGEHRASAELLDGRDEIAGDRVVEGLPGDHVRRPSIVHQPALRRGQRVVENDDDGASPAALTATRRRGDCAAR
jgi:hypothetical protein